jgi:predicted amidohydrolase YtcJ
MTNGGLHLVTADSVMTMDPGNPVAEAVLLSGGTVVRAGSRSDLRQEAPGAAETDLPGCTLIPGLVESHVHPVYAAMTTAWADCRSPQCSSIADIQAALRRQLATPTEWVRGWGYDDTLIAEMRHPTRDDLDAVAMDRPIVVSHISGHFAVANSAALQRAGISEETVSKDGVGFPRGADGRLTGMLWEIEAVARVFDRIPQPTNRQLRSSLLETLRYATSQGITALHDLGIGLMAGPEELGLYREIDAAGELPLTIVGFLRGDLALDDGLDERGYAGSAEPGSRFRLAGAKFWSDGSIQGLSAALRVPYQCRPDHCGELLQDAQVLADMCARAADAGAQVAVHANGDAAVEAAIAALGPLQRQRPRGMAPHRIEHCQVSTPEDLDAIHAAGLGVSFFANHIYYWGDRHEKLFLGPDRAAHMDALAWADSRGQRFGMHSDCPITPMDPLRTVWSAVSRRTRDGQVLGPDQRLTIPRALQAMTVDSHWLVGDHQHVGALRNGQRADLVAVDVDLVRADEDVLRGSKARAVMVEGAWAVAP